VLLNLNDQLAASVSSAESVNVMVPTGPTHIDLWMYTNDNWVHNLEVQVPVEPEMQIITQLGVNVSWSGFICNEDGHYLVNVLDHITCYDRNGNARTIVRTQGLDYPMKLLGFMLKESLLSNQTIPNRYDSHNRLPPFLRR